MIDFFLSWSFWTPAIALFIGYIIGKAVSDSESTEERLSQMERLAQEVEFPEIWSTSYVSTSFDGKLLTRNEMAESGLLIRVFGRHGSGVCISSLNLILTNSHVVGDQTVVEVENYQGKSTLGKVIKRDENRDVALIKISGSPSIIAKPIDLGQHPNVGDEIFISGSPIRTENKRFLTKGIVSKIGPLNDQLHFIHTDAAIAPGNSGGPAFNDKGELIGLSVAIQLDNEGNQTHMNLLIPINEALRKLKIRDPAGFHLWMHYDPDISNGQNREWREEYSKIKSKLEQSGEFEELEVPEFYNGEDFVEIYFRFNGTIFTISPDWLLSSISLECKSREGLVELKNALELDGEIESI